jgi:hydroxymethylbilane synthase
VAAALKPIRIATRGSALALAQARLVFHKCRVAFPELRFEILIVKTTGDKLQNVSLNQPDVSLPKGLFTKELEVALLERQADIAVHSLKDLPTEVPAGLLLGAVTQRADVRDVLLYRKPDLELKPEFATPWAQREPLERKGRGAQSAFDVLAQGATVATSSTRRRAQLLAIRPDLRIIEIRGNVLTRLEKLASESGFDATILAAAGLDRLQIHVDTAGRLLGGAVPAGLGARPLEPEIMLPCVGQGALGIEIRSDDGKGQMLCRELDHQETHYCTIAERSFLSTMGGGCLSPVAAYAEIIGQRIRLRAVSFRDGPLVRGELRGPVSKALLIGQRLARKLNPPREDEMARAGKR